MTCHWCSFTLLLYDSFGAALSLGRNRFLLNNVRAGRENFLPKNIVRESKAEKVGPECRSEEKERPGQRCLGLRKEASELDGWAGRRDSFAFDGWLARIACLICAWVCCLATCNGGTLAGAGMIDAHPFTHPLERRPEFLAHHLLDLVLPEEPSRSCRRDFLIRTIRSS